MIRKLLASAYYWLLPRVFYPLFDGPVIWLFYFRLRLKAGFGKPIRCVTINAKRIGPLVERADGVLRYRAKHPNDDAAWFGVVEGVCNSDLAEIISAHLPLVNAPTSYRSLVRATAKPSKLPKFMLEIPFEKYPDLFEGTRHILAFPDQKKTEAQVLLNERFGLKDSDRFVAFHARDEAYLMKVDSSADWAYHSYRNSSIETYRKAVSALRTSGVTSIRVGAESSQRLDDSWGPSVHDYASDTNVPMLDAYNMAAAEFVMIGGGSGLGHVAQVFGRPVIWTNFIPVHPWPWCEDDLFLPKLLRQQSNGRLLTFEEQERLGYFSPKTPMGVTSFYEEHGLEVVDNTADEITDAAMEMLDRLNGRLLEPEALELQDNFRRRFKPNNPNGGNISARFLERHKNLF